MSTFEIRPSHVAICVEFLRQCNQTQKVVKPYPTTYGLKHEIEDWAGDYVTEDECVAALMDCGFSLHWCGHGITFETNVDPKSIERMRKQRRSA